MGLTRSSIGYLAISIINAGFSLVMIPIMTRLLSPEDYGFITLFFAYYASIGALISISALTAYARSYYSIAEDRAVYLSTCLFLVAVTSLLFSLMSLSYIGDIVSELIGLSTFWQFIACLLVVIDESFAAKLLVNRMQNKILSFGIFDISRNVARLIFILLFTAYFNLGAAGAIYGIIINTFIFSIISIITLLKSKDLVLKIKTQRINEILSFGIPLTPHAMGGAISSAVDKFLIAGLLSNYELGLYAVGFSIGSIVKILE
ncbi:lipopolysaccharide biosynthesis protein, partial [Polynucleobacter sp. MWH-Jannik1A5]|uniref:lipopolysaccharide biosynthesis protein n=1 Tax=Polynucleobacter sp. MWH-Jannik1A5 TaxID=1855890 RepID=UPI001C0AAAB6